MERNALLIERELGWLAALVDAAIRLYFGTPCEYVDVREITPPAIEESDAPFACALVEHRLSFEERAVLALALTPHVRPQLLDPFFIQNPNLDRSFSEFGGVVHSQGGFLPTLETAAFLLCGNDLERRFAVQRLFEPDGTLRREGLIQLEESQAHGFFSAVLSPGCEVIGPFTTGAPYRPSLGAFFPAQLLTTPHAWSDLVLAESTMDDVEEIRAWIQHCDELMNVWQLGKKIKQGFRSLFYGPPGTGKTLTASLLGKSTGLDVYRVDLSLVVSKWVGETEKNLASVFDQAENKNWILFFDEADALFGKRTATSSSHDRYANQEVSFLLQRVEGFAGVVILATNQKANVDEAFGRRFQSMIYFPMPAVPERTRLWRAAFDPERLEGSIDIEKLAADFEISGGAIVNVLRYASLMALRRGLDKMQAEDIRHGIRREFAKSGRPM
ncbi:MAG TPA: ATP-binding protein [Bryobacteraceae bacterium]|jgi:hypothetical protein|nr:ATP-binding protein [Bryobacteraceae bacterium]